MPNPPTDPRDGFTPGPWSAGKPPHDDCIYGPDDWIVAKACPEQPAWLANARLIASAPTLLADNERLTEQRDALVAVVTEFRELMRAFDLGPACGEAKKWLAIADAALALAGGGE